MGGGEMTVSILDAMEMLDQEIAPPGLLAQEPAHLVERARIDLAALGGAWRPAPAAATLANCAAI
jgi:hypothetical protein